ncbi:copper chaperone PCu(A)C [Williamsia sp.]|uniref:copper chaperone PCu(A)C n=1 Tax=Williamsia sp. TaxID=1872085 RepID=UPI002F95AA72
MRRTVYRTAGMLTAATLCGAFLAGCGGDDSQGTQADSIVYSDQWVKAAESGMTAAFGELANTGDADVNLVAISSPITGRMEIHEMATGETGSMVMREKQGGLIIPANGSHSLEPGGDHLMFMDIIAPLTAGQTIDLTLQFADGSQQDVQAQVRDFSGNEENYDPGTDGSPEGSMEMAPGTPQHSG